MQVIMPLVHEGHREEVWIHTGPKRLAVLPVGRVPSRLGPVDECRHLRVWSRGDHDVGWKEIIVCEDNRRLMGDPNITGILELLDSIYTVERSSNSCTVGQGIVQWLLVQTA